MVQWMDRETTGFTQMGGEGANWIGEAPFSTRGHVFQNLGDGTYNHSGVLAIRAALSAGTTITYKILYNDAVAMTGGQTNEGGLRPERIAAELLAMGVGRVAVVHDEKEGYDTGLLPRGVEVHERAEFPAVQESFAETAGVSAIIYVQTCAAEKRRRRKRGSFPKSASRVFINTDVCEGCGDCGVQSNCVSLVPVETELGRKRAVDQSSCNFDMSCLKGFCPSFVTVEGAEVRKDPTTDVDVGELPEPALPAIRGTHNVVITGVGGTGVVTIGAVMAQAAQLDGLGAGMIEMAGLAQKGGAVHIHLRLARRPEDITAIRVATGEAHAVIGGDLVTTAGAKTLGLMAKGVTGAVVNDHEITTGDFTRNTEFALPTERLKLSLEARLGGRLAMFDASKLAKAVLGDSIFSNMMILGAAWQMGLVPLTGAAIRRAVELNGAAVEGNLRAFEIGRWAAMDPAAASRVAAPNVVALPKSLEERIAFREEHLRRHSGSKMARRYRATVDRIEQPRLREAVALGYHKLVAYKDEYEVARLHRETRAKAEAEFAGDLRLTYHLAPPIVSKTGADGRPVKRRFGSWIERAYGVLAPMKVLRGTPFDPFGRTEERWMERALIAEYEADLEAVLPVAERNLDAAVAWAEVPLSIRGFGLVKARNAAAAAKRREEALAALRAPERRAAAE